LNAGKTYIVKYISLGGEDFQEAVDKIVGPGREYVAQAKKAVFGTVDIDMVAGPSEVAILADASADPRLVALDLLSQAEHGSGEEIAIAVTESGKMVRDIESALYREIDISPVKDVFKKLAAGALTICKTRSRKQSLAMINRIAPEHLQIMTSRPREDLKGIENAGTGRFCSHKSYAVAVFLGHATPVAMGDYFVGTNHVLPTGGTARFASPLGVDSFQKRISVAEVTASGLKAAKAHVSVFARSEGFVHHAMSVEER